MSAPVKLAAYGAVLVVALVVGLGLGTVVGPLDVGDDTVRTEEPADRSDHDGGHG